MPSAIYRSGRFNESAAKDLQLRPGEEALSFRDSNSNPLGQNAVLKPGKPFIEVDVSKLPANSIILDGGLNGNPVGHVSVTASAEQIVKAITDFSGKYPK